MKVLRTGAILILLSVVLVVAGGAIGGRGGMQIALGIAVVMNFISYFFSDKIALASSGAQPGSEAVRCAGHGAERVCHRPQPESCFGGGDAGIAGNHERR